MRTDMQKRARALVCEFLGTAFLLAVVVGSGILAHKLDMGNVALSVLCVAISTGAVLFALINTFSSISAHFNPLVTTALALRGEFAWKELPLYVLSQILGGICGVLVTNLMFDLPALTVSQTVRSGLPLLLGEVVASAGLIMVIFGSGKSRPESQPSAISAYVLGAIYFTSSTCFANPAVTIARIFTDTLTGIAPASVLPFIGAQIFGLALALPLCGWLFQTDADEKKARLKAEIDEAYMRDKLENDYKRDSLESL